jgi:hypothetical protein
MTAFDGRGQGKACGVKDARLQNVQQLGSDVGAEKPDARTLIVETYRTRKYGSVRSRWQFVCLIQRLFRRGETRGASKVAKRGTSDKEAFSVLSPVRRCLGVSANEASESERRKVEVECQLQPTRR